MSRSGRETHPDVPEWWEALLNVRQFLRGPRGCSGVARRPSRMSGGGQEALPNVREWFGGPHGCPGVVGRSSWMSGSSREALPDVRE